MSNQPDLWNTEQIPNENLQSDPPEVQEILAQYAYIESKIEVRQHLDKVSYDAPVNFNEAMRSPRHRWFPYKEGFSPSFVRSFLRHHQLSDANIFDPFSGVGTTVLETCLQGGKGVGFDVNPLAVFIARTKALSLDSDQLRYFHNSVERFRRSKLKKIALPPVNSTVTSYYESDYLEALLGVKFFYSQLETSYSHDLFKLAFLTAIEPFSTHRKAGNGLKRKTRLLYKNYPDTPVNQVKQWVLDFLERYESDMIRSPCCTAANYEHTSSLEVEQLLEKDFFDCMLTSPPYANCFDYSKIYLCELWFGDFFQVSDDQKSFRFHSVRSHVHARWEKRYADYGSSVFDEYIYSHLQEKKLWSNQIPHMLQGYFCDIGRMLSGLAIILKKSAPVGIVVSNSVYGGIPIATDLLIGTLATRYGFDFSSIDIFRHIIPSSQQYVRINNKDFFRESMILLRKE